MTFACGVRLIRLRWPAVSGCASLSARAAASMAATVMGLGVLLEVVVVLLILRRPSGRNNANVLLALGIGNKQQNFALGHADHHKPLFAVLMAVIEKLDGKRVFKYGLRQIEAYAMSAKVGLGLGFVPLKFQFHNSTGNKKSY